MNNVKFNILLAVAVFWGMPLVAQNNIDSQVKSKPAETMRRKNEPDIRFGVVSDVHLLRPGHAEMLEKAFVYFRERDVDAVVIPGDIADTGRISELRRCADVFKRVFPKAAGRDGRRVEKVFIYGNHDIWGSYHMIKRDPDLAREDAIAFEDGRPERVWEEIFEEPYSDFYLKEIKGFVFIGAHWTKRDNFGGLADFLKSNADKIASEKPFFYIQHSHPSNTCIGAWAWGRDNGFSTQVLSKYPNAVAISGHSHYPLTNERSIWQGEFTSINASSLAKSSNGYSLRENFKDNSHGFTGDTRCHLMPRMQMPDSSQGLVVSVYGSELLIERRDFQADKSLGADWRISVPPRGDFSFKARADSGKPPEFAAGAKITIAEGEGSLLKLDFPAAHTVGGRRVFEYEITVTLVEDDVDLVQLQRRVMAPDFYKPETPGGVSASCVVSLDEIPIKGNTVFSVRPVDCFGVKGLPISETYDTGR